MDDRKERIQGGREGGRVDRKEKMEGGRDE